MRAIDIRTAIPIVDRGQSVAAASRVIVDSGKTGVVVSGGARARAGVISALDVLRLALPDYLLNDPSLSATLDEQAIEEMVEPLRDKTLAEVIDDGTVTVDDVPEVDADATMLEIAAVLVAADLPIAMIRGDSADDRRFVTLAAVLEQVLDAGLRTQRPGPTA